MYNLSECRVPSDIVNQLISSCFSGLFFFLVCGSYERRTRRQENQFTTTICVAPRQIDLNKQEAEICIISALLEHSSNFSRVF